ncbi:hypothetical protein V6N13_009695 [Hibiscus sabdariffa]|uniref:Uncharacterized protein n=1 Tax=Hibiscus sabdariffa TaxID=183260 RepID=A0ABR2NP57_9ROSI
MGIPFSIYIDILAFLCTGGAIWLAIIHIYRHLLNYTEPIFQRYIVRIIFMVPVYALMSFLSLVAPRSSIYFNSFREGYEAWVIYNFLSLCLAWVGGPGAVVLSLTGRVLKPSWFLMTCCLPPIPLDGCFIRRCKQGCLQFVILKPILVAVTLVLYAKGKYEDGNFSPNQAYLYLTIIYTISYTLALCALVLFYMACKDLLKPFNPVPKFIIIKSVVFLTYWQGVLVFLAAKSGFIKGAEEAAQFQNFLICVEMLIAAVGHLYAFPYKEYAGANIGGSRGFRRALAHALMLNDFYHDTVHQFAPTYHDYVLYNHNESDEGTRKYRSRTFVPTGPEMDAARRNKPVIPSKLEDIQLSSLPPDGTGAPQNPNSAPVSASADIPKSSLLTDHSNSSSVPYDMSLIDMDLSSYPSEVPAVKDTNPRIPVMSGASTSLARRLQNKARQVIAEVRIPQRQPRREIRWRRSLHGWLKLNIDDGARSVEYGMASCGWIQFEGILRVHQFGRYEKLPTADEGGRRGRPRRRWLKKMSGGIRLSRCVKLRFAIGSMNVIFSGHGWGLPTLSHPSLHQRPPRF